MWITTLIKNGPTSAVLPVITFLIVSILIFILILVKTFAPVTFQYSVSYTNELITMVYNDEERALKADNLSWVQEYKLHEMEMQFNQLLCKDNKLNNNPNYTWLTSMINDNYAVGAIYIGHVLKKLSCNHNMIALVADTVSKSSQDAMRKVGYDVRVVEPLDCNWMDRQKGQPERNMGLPGTHMRFHAWKYTEYSKIIYLDPDVMPLNNIDELFLMEGELGASYCARPGIVDPCFNAGLLMFEPSLRKYNEIMMMWANLTYGSNCPHDQTLLWHYYADQGRWTPLPYAYNVRRYLYHPMKVYHFACCLTKKPWLVLNKPTKEQTLEFKGPLIEPNDLVILWWKYFYEALDQYSLHDWYNDIKTKI